MRGSNSQLFLSIAVAVLLIGVLFFWKGQSAESLKIEAIDRSGSVLISNNRSDSEDYPFILEAKLVSGSSEELVFDIKYFMSDTIEGTYNISVHPDTSDWSYSANTLAAGINVVQIVVSFRPEHIGKKKSLSSQMLFYISHSADNKYIGKVFERTVDFPKTWMKSSGQRIDIDF